MFVFAWKFSRVSPWKDPLLTFHFIRILVPALPQLYSTSLHKTRNPQQSFILRTWDEGREHTWDGPEIKGVNILAKTIPITGGLRTCVVVVLVKRSSALISAHSCSEKWGIKCQGMKNKNVINNYCPICLLVPFSVETVNIAPHPNSVNPHSFLSWDICTAL